jgi:hypothetical protein
LKKGCGFAGRKIRHGKGRGKGLEAGIAVHVPNRGSRTRLAGEIPGKPSSSDRSGKEKQLSSAANLLQPRGGLDFRGKKRPASHGRRMPEDE